MPLFFDPIPLGMPWNLGDYYINVDAVLFAPTGGWEVGYRDPVVFTLSKTAYAFIPTVIIRFFTSAGWSSHTVNFTTTDAETVVASFSPISDIMSLDINPSSEIVTINDISITMERLFWTAFKGQEEA